MKRGYFGKVSASQRREADRFFADLMGHAPRPAQPAQPAETSHEQRHSDLFFADMMGEPPEVPIVMPSPSPARPHISGRSQPLLLPPAQFAEQPAPTPCVRRKAGLPFLLAGPIVRRAEPDGVWFWFACRDEVTGCTPRLTVYDSAGKINERLASDGGFYPLAPPEKILVARLGEHLWVVMVVARPKSSSFPRDSIYGYDLDIETRVGSRKATTKLSSLGLDITYRPFALPTFLLSLTAQRLAHGSCRRPGAHGLDAFPMFDLWLEAEVTNPSTRPSALILTGDQIYADDVAGPLFKAIQQIAEDVCGYVEFLPQVGGSPVSVATYLPGNFGSLPLPNSRKALTSFGRSPIGFTTDDGEAHLLSFPEYAAMYLVVWNEKLCQDYCVDDGTDVNLTGFVEAVRASRRVLANTATYMVFDDHDITDDWNLDADWEFATQNVMAQRIIANGLAAYWAFQGWGNDPGQFGVPADAVIAHLEAMRTSKGIPGNAAGAFDYKLLQQHWSFVAPTNPPALCVDIRTRRETPKKGEAAILSGRRVWPYLTKLAARHKLQKGAPLLIVLPTPLLPHPSLMVAQNHKHAKEGKAKADFEFYGNNPQQRADLINFLHILLDTPALIVFSGDVHHGSVIDGLYVHGKTREAIDKGGGDWAMRIAQVTSSPIKNVKADVFVDPIEVPNPFVGGIPIRLIDKGTAGELIVPMVGNTYHRMSDNTVIGTRAQTLELKGTLTRGRKTYIFENHLCVVDVPRTTDGIVSVTFVGVAAGKLALATARMRIDNRPPAFTPPPPVKPLRLPLPAPLPRMMAEMVRDLAGFQG